MRRGSVGSVARLSIKVVLSTRLVVGWSCDADGHRCCVLMSRGDLAEWLLVLVWTSATFGRHEPCTSAVLLFTRAVARAASATQPTGLVGRSVGWGF
jgi:hypothetical protein